MSPRTHFSDGVSFPTRCGMGTILRRLALFGLLWLVAAGAVASAAPPSLEQLLALDRFHYYLSEWSGYQSGAGREDLARAVRAWKPQEIAALNLPLAELADAEKYDGLIERLIRGRKLPLEGMKPDARVSGDFKWNRGFLKRKLNEAYRVAKPGPEHHALAKSSERASAQAAEAAEREEAALRPRSPVAKSEAPGATKASAEAITLNVDPYVSSKTTRAVFWDASASGRKVEFHMGSYGDFPERLEARGARVIGEIKTLQSNYNPIFLVQEMGESGAEYHFAITQISGADRLGHLVDQTGLARWMGEGNRSRAPPVELFGSAEVTLEDAAKALEAQLRALPPADQVILGQKGAVRKTLRNLSYADASLRAFEADAAGIKKVLEPSELKLLQKLAASRDFADAATEDGKVWERIHEKAAPLLQKKGLPAAADPELFTMANPSHEFSDYLLRTGDGKTLRWRVFSNVWGDEMLPIAEALKATGHRQVTYIGTAGALPGSGLKVGDLVVPDAVIDVDGKTRRLARGSMEIPGLSRTGATVTQVTTPFEETESWLKREAARAQVVELETGYLARVFNGREDVCRTFLLVSDVVGSADETLAEAESGRRRQAQKAVLTQLLGEDRIIAPIDRAVLDQGSSKARILAIVRRLAPNRDVVSQAQIVERALEERATTESAVQKLLAAESGFTSEALEEKLTEASRALLRILESSDEQGVVPRVFVSGKLARGSYHPSLAGGSVEVWLSASNAEAQAALETAVAEAQRKDPELARRLIVKVVRGPPQKSDAVLLPRALLDSDSAKHCLLEFHSDALISRSGVATLEGRTGKLKHAFLGYPEGPASADLAFFAPDPKTRELLTQLGESGDPEAVLEKEVARIQAFAKEQTLTWKIEVSTVSKIGDSGDLARITPEIADGGKSLKIHLRITPEGLKNPAVVLEELMHLQQITRAPVAWGKKADPFRSFIHPYHWAEVVWNAEQGSVQAQAKLAKAEAEAILASQDAVNSFVSSGLVSSRAKGEIQALSRVLEARQSHADQLFSQSSKVAREESKRRMAQWERTRTVRDALEKQAEKLNDLVARNDRKGTRKLIEAYIPWDLMEPSEVTAWKGWLDALEKPQKDNLKLVFRGMYDDAIMKTADGTPFLMSTMLSRNQGNYTRRLRSFATMRDKFGSEQLRDPTTAYTLKGSNPSGINVMMGNHAVEAKGSPFLSVADYDTATHFGPRKLGAFMIDERRLMPNPLPPTKYLWEQEKLVPLIIFPDEVVYFHDYWGNPVEGVGPKDPVARKAHFIGEVESRLGRKVSAVEMSGTKDGVGFLETAFKRMTEFAAPQAGEESARLAKPGVASARQVLRKPPTPPCAEMFSHL